MPPAVPLTYLTFDSVLGGVGRSQVLPYAERIARSGITVDLHSFEPDAGDLPEPPVPLIDGVRWHRHAFGRNGAAGGLRRVMAGAAAIRGSDAVHARSDLAASSALLARCPAWLWDVRSFWVDQRIAMGLVRAGSATERTMRRVEAASARHATVIVTLTHAAVDELARRHGDGAAAKARVVTTCVDLDHFAPAPLPDRDGDGVRLLLSGSFNPLYDVATMLRFTEMLRTLRPAGLTLLRPEASTAWDGAVTAAGGTAATSSFEDMPNHVRAHSAGLSVCTTHRPAALIGAMPTKIGELLACGRPVVVNTGLGDCDRLLPEAGAGVVLRGTSDADLAEGCRALLALVDDADTPRRCRALAERHFDVDAAVASLLAAYRELGVGAPSDVVG